MKHNPCSSVSICGYKFPESAKFEQVITKSKIYNHATPIGKVKELFVQEVEKIIWSYKLSPTTINLPAGDGVQEIQIFIIALRTEKLSQEVLRTIDKAIPSPIFFELKYGGKTKYAAGYKRPSEADKHKWVVSGYFLSDWMKPRMNTDKHRLKALPLVLSMGALYEALLLDLIPLKKRADEKPDSLVSRVELLRVKEREAENLDNRIQKEKQFNRQVELNRTLNGLKAEIEGLRK